MKRRAVPDVKLPLVTVNMLSARDMSESSLLSRWLPRRLWPDSRPRRWIHGMAAVVVGGTFAAWMAVMTYGFLIDSDLPVAERLFALGGASIVAVVTTLITAVPYVLGSLAARNAPRPYWIVGACAAVALVSFAFRVYAYGIAGGGQAFVNMIIHAVPFSAAVLTGWSVSLWREANTEGPSPSTGQVATVSAAAALDVGGSAAVWVLRESSLWATVGGALALASLGLGLWATRRARKEDGAASWAA
jgi:hypothetical protein